MGARLIHWILWPVLAVLVMLGAVLMYWSCGLVLFGLSSNYCPAGGGVRTDEIAALTLQVRQLERRLAAAPSCTAQIQIGGPDLPGGPSPGGSVGTNGAASPAPEPIGTGGAALAPGGVGAAGAPPAGAQPGGGPGGTMPAASPEAPAYAAPSPDAPDNAAAPDTPPEPASAAPEPADTTSPEPPGDTAETKPPSDCPASTGPLPPVVLALDHSKSMGLPADLSDRTVAELDSLIASSDETAAWSAQQIYDGYVARAGRKRLDELKDAVRAASTNADAAERQFGLVTFAGCEGGVEQLGAFAPERREEMVSAVEALRTRPATPLAQAINQSVALARTIGQDGTRILLVSDGIDTCGGDPCAAAAAAGVPIDVLAVGDPAALACIADKTGGRLLTRSGDASFETVLAQALAVPGGNGC